MKHRHLFNVGRAHRFQANLTLKFWGRERIQTTCYLINRLPTPLLSHKSPYQLLHNKLLTYNHLRTFECLCYDTYLLHTQKFDQRADRCIFVGYPLCQKVYWVYDLESNKFFSSQDVVFHEDIFPFHIAPQEVQDDIVVIPLPQSSNELTTIRTTKLITSNHLPSPTTSPSSPILDSNEPMIDHNINLPPPPPITHCSDRIKQPSFKLHNFHLYHTNKHAPNQSSSLTYTCHQNIGIFLVLSLFLWNLRLMNRLYWIQNGGKLWLMNPMLLNKIILGHLHHSPPSHCSIGCKWVELAFDPHPLASSTNPKLGLDWAISLLAQKIRSNLNQSNWPIWSIGLGPGWLDFFGLARLPN